MKNLLNLLPASTQEWIKQHGTFLTAGVAFGIVALGVTIVDSPQNWWVALLAVLGILVGFFVLINTRVVVKAFLTHFLLFTQAVMSFRLGAMLNPTDSTASLWMLSPFILFYACLSLTYWKPTRRSRWFPVSLVTMFSFVLIFAGLMREWNYVAVIAGTTIMCFGLFTLSHFYLGRKSRSVKDMPEIGMSVERADEIREQIKAYGWGIVPASTKNNQVFVAWNDSSCYRLTEVRMSQKFGIGGGKRRQFLTYKSREISSWLTSLESTLVPSWKTRGAASLLVLLDVDNVNGNEPKLIGVSLPDTKKQLPVAIFPAKNFINNGNYRAMITRIHEEFCDMLPTLNERQIHALDSRLDT